VQGNEGENMITLIIKYSLNLLNYFLNFLTKCIVLLQVFTVSLQIFALVLLLISLLLTCAAVLKKFRHHLPLLSFIFLMLGLALILAAILLSILMPTASLGSSTVTSYGYFGVVTGIVGAAIALVNAFIVKPYFKKVRITGNNLGIDINGVTVKNSSGKEIDKIRFSGPVIQCSLRLRSEHFAVPIYARNAIGWVALVNKAYNDIELHSGYAPWAYSHHYVLDIVGEESLILFLIPCPYEPCTNYVEQLKKNLNKTGCIDLTSPVRVIFPVRPTDIHSSWDRGLATEIRINATELGNLVLRVRVGGENTIIYEDEYELRNVINECLSNYREDD
jgi:hypothetical protein